MTGFCLRTISLNALEYLGGCQIEQEHLLAMRMNEFPDYSVPVLRVPSHQAAYLHIEDFRSYLPWVLLSVLPAAPLEGVNLFFTAWPDNQQLLLPVDQDLNVLLLYFPHAGCAHANLQAVESEYWFSNARNKVSPEHFALIYREIDLLLSHLPGILNPCLLCSGYAFIMIHRADPPKCMCP